MGTVRIDARGGRQNMAVGRGILKNAKNYGMPPLRIRVKMDFLIKG